jgi:hypothetical protein
MTRALLLASLAVTVSACSSAVAVDEAPPPTVPGSAAIAKIVMRDRSITLLAGHGTVRATVLDADGRLVAKEIPIDDLKNVDATAYEATHWSVAGGAAHEGLVGEVSPR